MTNIPKVFAVILMTPIASLSSLILHVEPAEVTSSVVLSSRGGSSNPESQSGEREPDCLDSRSGALFTEPLEIAGVHEPGEVVESSSGSSPGDSEGDSLAPSRISGLKPATKSADAEGESEPSERAKFDSGKLEDLLSGVARRWENGDVEKAEAEMAEALSLAEQLPETDPLLWKTLRKKGWLETLLKNKESARRALERSLLLAQKVDSERAKVAEIASLYGLARLHQASDEYDEAIEECQKALEIVKSETSPNPIIRTRILSLKSQLLLMKIEKNLDKTSEKQAVDRDSDFSEEPLTGNVSESVEQRSAAVPPLQAENASADQLSARTLEGEASKQSLSPPKQLKAKLDGSSKLRGRVEKMLEGYGTSGIFLSKVAVFAPVIEKVLTGGSAQAYGLKKGDILISIDGRQAKRMNMTQLHNALTGRRGESRTLVVQRRGRKLSFVVPLWSVYEMHDRVSEYVEYYWFLLYNKLITPKQFQRLSGPLEPLLKK